MMFDWDLSFHWFSNEDDWVPCMSGGLLAISKKWWHESGELDTGMSVWGGENIEQVRSKIQLHQFESSNWQH